MNGDARIRLQWPIAIVAAVALVAVGAIGSYLFVRPRTSSNAVNTSSGPSPAGGADGLPSAMTPAATNPLPDVSVNLSKDAIDRAGITVASVGSEGLVTAVRLPAIVEPNAYNQVVVTAVVSGRLTRVLMELGSQVRQGQTMATIFSPQLAEAQTQFIGATAQLAAHERELARVEKLVAIGSASRQELERLHAEHTALRTSVESARSRLELLGMSREALEGLAGATVNADAQVTAPISGILTERSANVGQNIEPSTPLFTIVDLSTVWVVANLYEQDFSRVRVGDHATVTFAAYPQTSIKGTVSYIDPQVSPSTRTAKARIEVPNPRRELRLGMLAEVQIGAAASTTGLLVPRSAVQNIGNRTVVYLASSDAPTRFMEREVRLGPSSGDSVAVLSGLAPGDLVVTEGSFFLRAERERLGTRPSMSSGVSPPSPPEAQRGGATLQTAKVLVTEQGFEPARVALRAGILARLTFVRTTDKTCGTEVVFPTLNIKRALPLNEPVEIAFTPERSGEITFVCGMDMLRGTVVVE